jgi:hypothetical protein
MKKIHGWGGDQTRDIQVKDKHVTHYTTRIYVLIRDAIHLALYLALLQGRGPVFILGKSR